MLGGVLYYIFFAITVALAGTDLNAPLGLNSESTLKVAVGDDAFVNNINIYNKVLDSGAQFRSSVMAMVNNWKLKE